MGLPSDLRDISGDSIPLILLAATACWVSSLRGFLLRVLHTFGLQREEATAGGRIGSAIAGLIVLAGQLVAQRPFSGGSDGEECPVCLEGVKEGERVRMLPCCRHLFHSRCLDHWFDEYKRSCPLCRSTPVPENRGIGTEPVHWLAPY